LAVTSRSKEHVVSNEILTTNRHQGTHVVRRHPLASFLILAFSLSWGGGAVLNGIPLIAPDGIFIAGVLIAALVITGLNGGRAALADIGRRLLPRRVGALSYLAALALPILLVGGAVAALPLVGGSPATWANRPELAQTAVLFLVLLLLPLAAPIGEEIGWRGVALPNLLTRRSPLTASLILGGIWSVWHLPGVLANPALRVPAPFLLSVVPLAVLFTWLFLNSGGSLFVAVLFHAWFDLVLGIAGAMVARNDFGRMWWLLVVSQSLAAVVVVVAQRRRFLRRQPFAAGKDIRGHTTATD
jgi:membrane protease YdiL (CAAX protease family)